MARKTVAEARKNRAPWHVRARAGIAGHPITVGALASFVVAVYPMAQWVDGHYMSRAEGSRKAAWLAWQIADVQETIMQNRVNECTAKDKSGTMTVFEASVCNDYAGKLAAAKQMSARLLQEAREASK